MDNLHINNTAPTRTCLPPPGFSSAPNQVNSYGISIPRNTGKFLIYIFHILKFDTKIISNINKELLNKYQIIKYNI